MKNKLSFEGMFAAFLKSRPNPNNNVRRLSDGRLSMVTPKDEQKIDHCLDNDVLIKQLRGLNPDVKIELLALGGPKGFVPTEDIWLTIGIRIDVTPAILKYPRGYYWNRKHGLTCKHMTRSGGYSDLEVVFPE